MKALRLLMLVLSIVAAGCAAKYFIDSREVIATYYILVAIFLQITTVAIEGINTSK